MIKENICVLMAALGHKMTHENQDTYRNLLVFERDQTGYTVNKEQRSWAFPLQVGIINTQSSQWTGATFDRTTEIRTDTSLQEWTYYVTQKPMEDYGMS
ncbi:hypothetical protein QJQ59_05925 (plasmid) [Klebsiella michiganensis]|nr:hypothetical protein QJQ59_01200 [Klebsiella michiganensis]WGZ97657.1 hypothetical protein QJQ59_05925 [Klebsiella michiganensis]